MSGRWLGAVLVLGLFLFPSAALSAVEGSYLSFHGAYVAAKDGDAGLLRDLSYDRGFGLGAALGQEVRYRYLRFGLEGELSYTRNALDEARVGASIEGVGGTVGVLALLVNARYWIETSTRLRPFVTAGVGAAWTRLDDAEVSGVTMDDDVLQYAYQGGVGAELAVAEHVAVDLGYRYFATSRDTLDAEFGAGASYQYVAHNLYLGLRYRF